MKIKPKRKSKEEAPQASDIHAAIEALRLATEQVKEATRELHRATSAIKTVRYRMPYDKP